MPFISAKLDVLEDKSIGSAKNMQTIQYKKKHWTVTDTVN